MVWPSGAALAASSVPIIALAPPRLSTTTCWPRRSGKREATIRPTVSTAPPGGNGAIKRTGRVGDHCAAAVLDPANTIATVNNEASNAVQHGRGFEAFMTLWYRKS